MQWYSPNIYPDLRNRDTLIESGKDDKISLGFAILLLDDDDATKLSVVAAADDDDDDVRGRSYGTSMSTRAPSR